MSAKNKKHFTAEQKNLMVAFMLSHKELAQGKLNGNSYKRSSVSFSIF